MSSIFLLLISSALSITTVSSSALPSPSNLISSSLNQPAVFETPTTNNTSLQDLGNPALSYNPDCSILYGRDLNHASCSNAVAKISQVTTTMMFGERGTGNWDIILPRRYLSGTSFVDSLFLNESSLLEQVHIYRGPLL